jgi:L-alanine-DL-glutamate epimerase-like enolase superfamily enzyme
LILGIRGHGILKERLLMFKIASLDAFGISVPLKKTVTTASGSLTTADNLIIRMTDTDGTVGWGEAPSAPAMMGETHVGMVAAAQYMATRLEGAETPEFSAFYSLVNSTMYGNNGAKAAIEIAMLDIAGKRLGKPLYELLGGSARTHATMVTFVAGGTLESEVANAKLQADAGFTSFKVKVGVNSPQRDLERTHAIRQALGSSARISGDANQGYTPDEALDFAKGAADAGLDFMEQLVMGTDLENMARCAAATEVPLGADEGYHSIDDIQRHHDLKAAAGGSLKTLKLGGAYPVLEASKLMNTLDMHVNLAGKLADTSIGSAAIAHLAIAVPQLDWDTSITNQYLADDIVTDPIAIHEGRISVSDSPGLGVNPTQEALTKYTTIR